jgi:hypothetical protein
MKPDVIGGVVNGFTFASGGAQQGNFSLTDALKGMVPLRYLPAKWRAFKACLH